MNIDAIGMGIVVAGLSAAGFRFGSIQVGGVSGGLAAVLIMFGVFV